jgi:hypothetical protein
MQRFLIIEGNKVARIQWATFLLRLKGLPVGGLEKENKVLTIA